MDISALLSPSPDVRGEAPTTQTPTPSSSSASVLAASSPSKSSSPRRPPLQRPGGSSKRASSSLSQQVRFSPPAREGSPPQKTPSLPRHAITQAQAQAQIQNSMMQSPALSSAGSARSVHRGSMSSPSSGATSHPRTWSDFSAAGTPSVQQSRLRQPSTPGMDALADLASMQHRHQTVRPQPLARHSSGVASARRGRRSSSATPQVQALPRGSIDINMADAPVSPPVARQYITKSLSSSELQEITKLVEKVNEQAFDYPSHVQLIKLLHPGLISHVTFEPPQDPHTYELLSDLRQARNAMDSRFAVGEELWVEWLQDERMLARTTDERMAVVELCQRAVEEEPGSTALWRLYGEWMWSLYANAHGIEDLITEDLVVQRWTEEDRMIGREIFGWNEMLSVWERGATATHWHIDSSHHVWDRYMEVLLFDIKRAPSLEKLQRVRNLFLQRLRTPHATFDQTFSMFSSFTTEYEDQHSYEEVMVATNKAAAAGKQAYNLRETFELQLQRTRNSGDQQAEWAAFQEYVDWELQQSQKKNAKNKDLLIALYERYLLRFPADAGIWEDSINSHLELQTAGSLVLNLSRRATRHCPWSGELWSRHIIASEAAGQQFPEVEEVKHKATRSGLLDVGALDELLKMYTSWCGYLRRRAYGEGSTEDDIDVAEVGIRSALEDVQAIGNQLEGNNFKGDPLYRLERIFIGFAGQSGHFDTARNTWDKLVDHRGQNWEFWYHFYAWEMVVWNQGSNMQMGRASGYPCNATEVLRRAVDRADLDFPEKAIEQLTMHCEHCESVQVLQEAKIQVRRASKLAAQRREKEAMEAAAAQYYQQQQTAAAYDQVRSPGGPKRKWDEAENADEAESKRARPNGTMPDQPPGGDASSSANSQAKRDRENTTVVVSNLPADATKTRVRQFFRECGAILSITLLKDANDESSTATIEFESQEDVLTAQTRNMRSFDGRPIDIKVGSGTTLFVTNYPPTADETFIRSLFKNLGEIVEVRFPSLKYNAHRRFCYIQFLTSSQAQAATRLHGTTLSGGYQLGVELSDPGQKKKRTSATDEGREVYVGNVHWQASESDIRELFSKHGEIENVRIPRNVAGRSKGAAFVIFKTREEAEASLELNMEEYRGRILNVSIASSNAKGPKKQSTTIINQASASPQPESQRSMSEQADENTKTSSSKDRRERTIALLNIPDTVNDARVRALMEKYGALRKIVLRPDHQGAIVEFTNVQDVGKAMLEVDGYEIDPGRVIRVGTVNELLKQEPEIKVDRVTALGKGKQTGTAGGKNGNVPLMPPGPIRRPNQPGGRRGGRGGLGLKRGGIVASSESRSDDAASEIGKAKSEGLLSGAKTNADFKAVFMNKS